MKRRWITMPVDTAVRDLESRVLLACAAARAGFGVIVGSQRAIEGAIDVLPKGIMLWNNIDRSKVAKLRMMRARGYRIVVLDDEGLLFFSDMSYAGTRLSADGMAEVDYMMAPSPNGARIIREFLPQFRDKVIETGNPRIDLLRPELRGVYQSRVNAHNIRFGHFILINTNTTANASSTRIQSAQLEMSGSLEVGDGGRWIAQLMEHDQQKLASFREMVRCVSRALPSVNIVLRPHPVENFDRWRDWLRECPNVTVLHEGAVYSWALAAAAVVHNSCTTGLESHLLGRTVISYRPTRSEFDHHLPNAVSEEITDLVTLGNRLRQAVEDAQRPPSKAPEYRCREMLEDQLGTLSGPFAFERIVEVFDRVFDLPLSSTPSRFETAILKEDAKELIRVAAQQVPTLGRAIFGDVHLDFWRYHHQAFGSVPLGYIRQRVADISRVLPPLAGVSARSIAHGLFVLTAS